MYIFDNILTYNRRFKNTRFIYIYLGIFRAFPKEWNSTLVEGLVETSSLKISVFLIHGVQSLIIFMFDMCSYLEKCYGNIFFMYGKKDIILSKTQECSYNIKIY